MKKRTGKSGTAPYLLTEEHLQARLKALGEVKLENKRVIQLADRREQVEAVYFFLRLQ